MDLSMILSPAVEEDEPAPPPPPEPNRKWSSDELQCAVAILQDFQQPGVESPAAARDVARGGRGEPHAVGHEQEHKYAQQDAAPVAISRSLDGSRATAPGRESAQGIKKRKTQTQQQQQQSSTASSAVWGDDSLSKLSLLVEADAIIKRRRPKAPPSPSDDKPEYLRSGVWSRAEEKYAAALLSYFLEGLLDLPEGMTLRKFMAEKLCCNRRRVSMKLGTESLAGQRIPRKVGASVFVVADPPPSDEQRQEVERVLAELREASFSSGFQGSGRRRHHDEDAGESYTERKMSNGYEDDASPRRQKTATKRKWTRKEAKPKRGKPTIIRTGFETPEEEEFVTTMCEFFMAGALDLPEGTKLVNYLCQQLGCSPKQLSMKLAPKRMGERKFPDNVGAITYKRKDAGDASSDESDDDDFSEELFEVESRITELRLAHEEAHKSVPPPLTTPVKRERKFSTASVSSTGTASVASTPSASPVRSFRRSGPWSHDEETYAAALIDCFFKGVLDIAEGTTLRSFLSTRLCCNPMRVSKKLASESIAEIPIPKKLGSSTYVQRAGVTPLEQSAAEESLRSLQDVYMHSSTTRRDGVLGSKRPRQSRVPRRLLAAVDTDSDDTGSDSNGASPFSRETSPEKLQKTDKTHSPAQEARRQRFHVPHIGPELHVVVPAPLKEQLA